MFTPVEVFSVSSRRVIRYSLYFILRGYTVGVLAHRPTYSFILGQQDSVLIVALDIETSFDFVQPTLEANPLIYGVREK